MIRASVDLRIPNKHLERSWETTTPTVKDFTRRFHDCSIWTKMDHRQGYNQLTISITNSLATLQRRGGIANRND